MNGDSNDPHRYDDIIDLPAPVSKRHPPLSRESRAAQFSPFAALTGYDDVIQETARLTDRRMELDDAEKLAISDKLQLLLDSGKQRPVAAITRFQPDGKKQGGRYAVVTGSVKKVDPIERLIVMTGGERIPIDDVIAVESELFRERGDDPD